MIDLVFGDVKPRPVRIESGRNSQRCLEPRVIARRERRERRLTCPPQLVDIELQLVTTDLEISLDTLHTTANQLLSECGQLIRRLVAGLSMPDWPEGARRAISISIGPIMGITAPVFAPVDGWMERLREADALAFETEGD